jgi:hypothetical protein
MTYAKTIAALVVGVAAIGLSYFGLTPDSTISDVVTALVVAGSVYFVPNKKR